MKVDDTIIKIESEITKGFWEKLIRSWSLVSCLRKFYEADKIDWAQNALLGLKLCQIPYAYFLRFEAIFLSFHIILIK